MSKVPPIVKVGIAGTGLFIAGWIILKYGSKLVNLRSGELVNLRSGELENLEDSDDSEKTLVAGSRKRKRRTRTRTRK
jgi:hypothetical protein